MHKHSWGWGEGMDFVKLIFYSSPLAGNAGDNKLGKCK